MVHRRSIKKVEIADDSVVDLKTKDRVVMTADMPNFSVHKINTEIEQQQPLPRASFESTGYERAEVERPIKSPKFDPDELQQRMENFAEKLERAVIKVSPGDNAASTTLSSEPKDLIRVKFDKFVQLVASRDFIAVMEKNRDEDIVLSSNLLTELAGAVEEKSEKKTPVIFLVGLAIGVVITYLLINR